MIRSFFVSLLLILSVFSSNSHAVPVTESEPNNTALGAIPLVRGFSGFGNIINGPDSDNWMIPFARQGDQMFFLCFY